MNRRTDLHGYTLATVAGAPAEGAATAPDGEPQYPGLRAYRGGKNSAPPCSWQGPHRTKAGGCFPEVRTMKVGGDSPIFLAGCFPAGVLS